MRFLPILVALLALSFTTGKPKLKKYIKDDLAFVPAGKVYLRQPSVISQVEQKDEADSCLAFYMKQGEVTNGEYIAFLAAMRNSPKYSDLLPDTTVWRDKLAYFEPYVEYYFQHEAYRDYPVVGVTREQAEAFCEWKTATMRSTFNHEGLTFRLPTKKEFIRAGRGDNLYAYASGGPYLRNSKGCFLYNFRVVGDQAISYNEADSSHEIKTGWSHELADGGLITTQTCSYFPSLFGIYNLSGNVAELIADENVAMGGSWNNTGYDIRLESELDASKPSSMIGFRYVVDITE